jgi:hypothetical protein
MRRLMLGAIALSVVACSSITPVKVQSGEVCYRCRRVIADEKLAAETIDGRVIWKFRSAGCVAKYLADHPKDTSVVFVTDHKSGQMVQPQSARFVPTINRDNGEIDYISFSERAVADAEAFSRGTKSVSWNEVMDQARKAAGN